jgi:hypothetical protein
VVALVLHYAGQKAGYLLLVGLKVLVEPAQHYMLGARHLFRHARQAEAALGARYGFAFENLYFGIYQCEFATGAFGKAVGHGVGVDYHEPYVFAYLGRGQPDAF